MEGVGSLLLVLELDDNFDGDINARGEGYFREFWIGVCREGS